MLKQFINDTSMYRLVLYALILLTLQAFIFSVFGLVHFSLIQLVLSLGIILSSCVAVNEFFSKLFHISVNFESSLITGLIIFLISDPAFTQKELFILGVVSALAIISKYAFVVNNMHIFNPAALGVFVGGLLFNYPATWWIGSTYMFPLVLVVGLILVRKTRRESLVVTFITVSSLLAFSHLKQFFVMGPVLFFSSIMLTEPLTMPGRKNYQIYYGIFVAVLFSIHFNVKPISSSPELALLIGNVVMFLKYPRTKVFMLLTDITKLADDIYEFSFLPNFPLKFLPGQYLEWTLPHAKVDKRGVRRYFTISSSPTDKNVKIGIKFNKNGSSFKKALFALPKGFELSAGQLGGDFVINDFSQELIFIAGGIGITPFISIIRYILATGKRANITLFYLCKKSEDFAYKSELTKAKAAFDLKINLLTSSNVNAFKDANKGAKFYISGPSGMVEKYIDILKISGISNRNIHTDFFPGF